MYSEAPPNYSLTALGSIDLIEADTNNAAVSLPVSPRGLPSVPTASTAATAATALTVAHVTPFPYRSEDSTVNPQI